MEIRITSYNVCYTKLLRPNVVLFPESDPNYVNMVVELPVGTDITGTNEFAAKLEQDVIDYLKQTRALIPGDSNSVVESILTTVGKGDPNDFSAQGSVITSYSIHYTKLYEISHCP